MATAVITPGMDLEEALSALGAALSNEADARAAADTAETSRATARENAIEAAYQAADSVETSARMAADASLNTTLSARVATETAARSARDTELQNEYLRLIGNIIAEINAARGNHASLQSRFDRFPGAPLPPIVNLGGQAMGYIVAPAGLTSGATTLTLSQAVPVAVGMPCAYVLSDGQVEANAVAGVSGTQVTLLNATQWDIADGAYFFAYAPYVKERLDDAEGQSKSRLSTQVIGGATTGQLRAPAAPEIRGKGFAVINPGTTTAELAYIGATGHLVAAGVGFVYTHARNTPVRIIENGELQAEWFGTVRDAATINRAIAAAATVTHPLRVRVGPGQWTVPVAVRLMSNVELSAQRRTVFLLTANVNGIEVVKESYFHGGGCYIDTSGVSGYSKAAVYGDGSTLIQTGSILTGASHWHAQGNWAVGGAALRLETNTPGARCSFSEWSHFTAWRFGIGISLVSKTELGMGAIWTNGNKFFSFNLSSCLENFNLDSTGGIVGGDWATCSGNIFSDFEVQPALGTSVRGILARGIASHNEWKGKFWDIHQFSAPIAFDFGDNCEGNLILGTEIPADRILFRHYSNRLITTSRTKGPSTSVYLPGSRNIPSFQGDQDDVLAYAHHRHTVTQTAGPATTASTFDTIKSRLFDGNRLNNVSWTMTATDVVIEIALAASVVNWYSTTLQFLSTTAPSKLKLEVDTNGSGNWVALLDSTTNTDPMPTILHGVSASTGATVHKLRITFNHTLGANISLNRILGFIQTTPGQMFVRTGGTQTIYDVKTFNSAPVMPGASLTRPPRADGAAPTAATGAAAGTGATVAITGDDFAGKISVTTAGTPSLNNNIAVVTLSATNTRPPRSIVLTPANDNAATWVAAGGALHLTNVNATSWRFNARGLALTTATVYEWYYMVVG